MSAQTFVVGITQREDVQCGPRRYTLRPITYGEAAEIERRRAAAFLGGPPMLFETIREALSETLPAAEAAAAIAAVDAHEEADAEFSAIALSIPHPQESPEAFAAYREAKHRAQLELMRAARGRTLAEARVAEHPKVIEAKAALDRANRRYRDDLIRYGLVAWEGEGLRPYAQAEHGTLPEGALEALPVSDVEALFAKAEALRRPGPVEGKASAPR